jgi:hypothetical protein
VMVTSPIGYILRYNTALDLTLPDGVSGGTTTSGENRVAVEHSGALLIPIVEDETWEEHFIDNEWSYPDDQIDEGYDLYAQPTDPAGGFFQQIIDMGVLLPPSRVALVTDTTVRDGAPTSEFTISTSEDDITYDEYGGLLEFYSLAFRYVKVRVEVNVP